MALLALEVLLGLALYSVITVLAVILIIAGLMRLYALSHSRYATPWETLMSVAWVLCGITWIWSITPLAH